MNLAALSESPPWRWLMTLRDFVFYVVERFIRDNGLRHASTLAYTTLLSIVPLMTVAFSVLAAFPVFEPIIGRIHQLIFSNLVPASGEMVQGYIARFSSKAAGLTGVGIIGLLVSALLMMSAVDKALNEIWQVRQRRRMLQGFMIYWTLLTLGPLLIGASLIITSYVESLQAFSDFEKTLPRQMLFNLISLLSEFMAFFFMYSAVPNRRVSMRHAALGALLVSLLFEAAKLAFAWYVTSFPTYEAIYGALAALPLFLIWLYLSWTLVLLGAVFTRALGDFRSDRLGPLSTPRMRLVLAVRLMEHLWRAQRRGSGVSRKGLIRREPRAGDEAVSKCLDALERAKVVLRIENGDWALARDLSDYTLLDLYQSHAFLLPEQAPIFDEGHALEQRLADVLHEAALGVQQAMRLPLEQLFQEEA
jgi:membrane protein